jgi:hypothetical protein
MDPTNPKPGWQRWSRFVYFLELSGELLKMFR